MKHWLMKSEPDVFSIDDLKTKKRSGWDGVRNYQARNFMRDGMSVGDLALFYHSNAAPSGVAGICRVSKTGLVDPSQFDKKSEYYDPKATQAKPIWQMVEVEYVEKLPRLVSLDELRKDPALKDLMLLHRSRLSITPVDKKHWEHILRLAGHKA